METRSSPSMRELRVIAHERGLKYYLHLSKPELYALLQRKHGGGTGASLLPLTASTDASNSSAIMTATSSDAAKKCDGRFETATESAVVFASSSESTCASSADARTAALVTAIVSPQPTRSSLRLSTLKRNIAPTNDEHSESSRQASTNKSQKQKKRQKTAASLQPIDDETNTLDPIMMCELGPYTFKFVRTNGSVVVYNVETLVQYILATGDFSEPQTRIPFSEANLRQIDCEAKAANLGLKSVWEAKKNKHEFEEQKVKRDGILGLERCAGEFVAKMLDVVESDDPEEGEMMLIMSLFPSFSDIYSQIRSSDYAYARQCMNHFKAYLRGPKNRPTVDTSGLLPVILGFLDDVSQGGQTASAFGF